ncbi:MAG TPA: hypothetical protein VEQ63_03720 [Bryobacteraceae bacterium]|nr:hypothetical protein [Bryobacteraceae bacterium]
MISMLSIGQAGKGARKQDTSGVHVWLVLAKAFHAMAAHVRESLDESRTGLGYSTPYGQGIAPQGTVTVNTIRPKYGSRWDRSVCG